MDVKKRNLCWLVFILIYTIFYYSWLLFWQENTVVLTWGGNIFAILGCLAATCWLLSAAKEKPPSEKPFWFLLAFGTISYCFAEIIWMIYESFLRLEVPFPGPNDFFYLALIGFYLAAFTYRIIKEKRKHHLIKFLFDVLIIMTVASTFSWHFLIQPIVAQGNVSLLTLLVSVAYPIGDLALFLGAVTICFALPDNFSKKIKFFLFLGLTTQIFADSAYLYFISIEQYPSGSLVDPLFIAAILFVGFTGLLSQEASKETPLVHNQTIPTQPLNFLKLIIPYLTVMLLFVFMSLRSTGMDAVTVGSGISVLLVIIRQILILRENQRLLRQFQAQQEKLAVTERCYRSTLNPAGKLANVAENGGISIPVFYGPDKNKERIQFLAFHDSLTGLANRALFNDLLQQAVENAENHQQSFAVMFLDMDNFKAINDTLGHDGGDQLLVMIANRLKKNIRQNDLVARQGGDEFTFLIRDIFNREEAIQVAENVIRSLAQPYSISGKEVRSSPSIGIALYPDDAKTPADLLKKADTAMYQVKENGKGHYRLFDQEKPSFN
ncbi:DUF4084 domain-containing protein [Planococcus sp. YIM B11945]|uniref:DUF4084 domain-containing protein n=1 Tax=Planococcus sp. YIM B11945 TaxID=3435410 RepID=UPI003D7C9426